MKMCTKCKENKHLDQYSKQKSNKSGLRSWCKNCVSNNEVIYRKNHVEKLKLDKKIYSKNNKERLKAKNKEHYENNKQSINIKSRKYYQNNKEKIKISIKIYAKEHRGSINANSARYRAAKVAAIPKNFTKQHRDQIRVIYRLASTISRIIGKLYHVDHIIPLQGRNGEKGEHAIWNLRIIKANGDNGNHAKNNIISKEFLEEQQKLQALKKESYEYVK